jgi:hypothetical protein
VVHDCVSKNSDTVASASVDHGFELLSGSHPSLKFVRDGLIHEPPRVQLAVLRPRVGEHGFLWRENSHSHVSCLANHLALLLNVSVRPSEHLNDGTFLAALVAWVVAALAERGSVPDEVNFLKSNLVVAVCIRARHSDGLGILEGGVVLLRGGTDGSLRAELVLEVADARSSAAEDVDSSALSSGIVVDARVAGDLAEVLVLFPVVRSALVGSLELSVSPVFRVLGLLSSAAHFSVEVGAVHGLGDCENSC